jgi:hypothetical protein
VIKDMKPNGVKKDGNKKLLASVMKIYVYQELQVCLTPHLYLSRNSASVILCAALGEFEF